MAEIDVLIIGVGTAGEYAVGTVRQQCNYRRKWKELRHDE
jgi:hypothetical protein